MDLGRRPKATAQENVSPLKLNNAGSGKPDPRTRRLTAIPERIARISPVKFMSSLDHLVIGYLNNTYVGSDQLAPLVE
jgi:hypothetical protein